jgi:hypothetical protein
LGRAQPSLSRSFAALRMTTHCSSPAAAMSSGFSPGGRLRALRACPRAGLGKRRNAPCCAAAVHPFPGPGSPSSRRVVRRRRTESRRESRDDAPHSMTPAVRADNAQRATAWASVYRGAHGGSPVSAASRARVKSPAPARECARLAQPPAPSFVLTGLVTAIDGFLGVRARRRKRRARLRLAMWVRPSYARTQDLFPTPGRQLSRGCACILPR